MIERYLSYQFIEIEQPIGTIYMGKLNAGDIYSISYSRVRDGKDRTAIQRIKNGERVKAIATYCNDPDAIFPTPIILSGDSSYVDFDFTDKTIHINVDKLKANNYKFSIVDGQHRLEGIHQSGYENRFILPIMLILDTTPEQDAYLFSVINGNQKPVSKSLVLDLFDLSSERTVQKVCNYLVKQLNSDPDSALYRRIKMLGIKSDDAPDATVSQATIIRNLMGYFSKDINKDNLALKQGHVLESLDLNKYIFREYFESEADEVIYKILYNFFNAISVVESKIQDEKTINFLQKTIGYTVKIQLLRPLFLKGYKNRSLKESFFIQEIEEIFTRYITNFPNKKVYENYGSSDGGARKLYFDYIFSWTKNDENNLNFINDSEKNRINQMRNELE